MNGSIKEVSTLEELIPNSDKIDFGIDPSVFKNKELSKRTFAKESSTRKKTDKRLIELGWNIDEENPNCNVFTERAKTEEQNKKFKGSEPDYVLYKSRTDTPIGIIETKRKGENLDKALKDAKEKYADPLGVKILFVFDGGIQKSFHLEKNRELTINGKPLRDFISESILLRFVNEGADIIDDVAKKQDYTKEELIKIFKESNDLLRKDGLREGTERFTEFANVLFLKYISEMEEKNASEGKRRKLDENKLWNKIKEKDEEDILDFINDTVFKHIAEKYGDRDKNIFENALLIKNPKTLKIIIDKLSTINLLDAETDVSGDAFEYFLKSSVTLGNDLGEYFTPRHIINLMIDLIEPKFGETIYDPACGTGGFLIAAFERLKKNIDLDDKDSLKKLRKETLFGNELTNTSKIAKMNMILHGDGHNNIKQIDSLANPVDSKYKIALANIPYSQKTDSGNYYDIETDKGDVVFLLHIFKSLKNGGKAAVIVPQGFLFRSGIEEKARKYLLNNAKIHAIIAMPSGVFKPYTGVTTNILLFEKGSPTEKIWLYYMRRDGYSLDDRREFEDGKGDIPDILEKFKHRVESKQSVNITIDEIKENEYNLNVPRYINTVEPEKEVDLQDVHNKLRDLTKRRNELEFITENDLKGLGISI